MEKLVRCVIQAVKIISAALVLSLSKQADKAVSFPSSPPDI
jgi:hypothetical protein